MFVLKVMEVTTGEEERISISTPVLSSTGELSGYLYKKTRDGIILIN